MSDFERVITEIPGPRSRALAARLRATESRGVTFISEDSPTFWASASGATVTDVDGNRYLDLSAAFGVAATGHANPAVAQAIAVQSARLPHGMGDVHPADVKATLLDRLCALAPMPGAKAFLCTSGAESVEFALKTALLATGRPNALAFEGSYHGLSLGALEVTGIEKFRVPFVAQLRDTTTFVPFPDRRDALARDRVLDAVDAAFRADASIGAVVVEPIQGRAGVIVPPDGFLAGLRRLCDQHERLLVVDEIYTGFGRTGALFAALHEGVVPDLLCVGKALAGGFPFAATLGRSAVMDAWPSSLGEALHTSTYLGNPMGCAAALANLAEIERLGVVERAGVLEPRIAGRLGTLRTLPGIVDVRGRGALWGIECDAGARANAWVVAALRRGVIALASGIRGETVTVAPPLVIDEAQLDRALDLLIASIAQ
jgi:4-aminobutyrate aminotransferase-like enzyme